jgi:hypothetical protein
MVLTIGKGIGVMLLLDSIEGAGGLHLHFFGVTRPADDVTLLKAPQ